MKYSEKVPADSHIEQVKKVSEILFIFFMLV